MPHGSSQIVGLIEIDEAIRPGRFDQPPRALSAHGQSFSDGECECEIVQADFAQINDDLCKELAQFAARIAAHRLRRSS